MTALDPLHGSMLDLSDPSSVRNVHVYMYLVYRYLSPACTYVYMYYAAFCM